MKHAWSAVLLLAVACATPESSAPEVVLSPWLSEPSAFDVPDLAGRPETRRYRIKPEEILATGSPSVYDNRPTDGRGEVPATESIDDMGPAVLADTVRLVRSLVAPESWAADARLTAYVEGDEIVVRHFPAALAQVERLFDTLKANRKSMARLYVQFLTMSADDMRAIRHLPLIREGLGGVIKRADLARLVPADALGRRRLMQSPYLVLFHAQTGVIQVGSRFPYMKGAKPKGAEYEPVIDYASRGVEVSARAVTNGPESDRFLVDAAVEVKKVNSMSVAKLGDYYVQLPSHQVNRTSGTFVLGPGQAAILLSPAIEPFGPFWGMGFPGSLVLDPVTLVILSVDRIE